MIVGSRTRQAFYIQEPRDANTKRRRVIGVTINSIIHLLSINSLLTCTCIPLGAEVQSASTVSHHYDGNQQETRLDAMLVILKLYNFDFILTLLLTPATQIVNPCFIVVSHK
jgi:hypothetical protein